MEPEADCQAGAERRQGKELQGRFGDDPQQALGTNKEPVQFEAGLVLVSASAQPEDGSIGENNFEAEHIVSRDAVLEAAGATRVGADVAADDIVFPAGRVGWVKQALLFDCVLECLGINAGLDDGHEVGGVDFLDAIHPCQRKHDAAADGHAATDVALPGPARRDRDVVPAGEAQQRRDRAGAAWQNYGVRFVRREPFIASVFLQDRGFKMDLPRGQESLES